MCRGQAERVCGAYPFASPYGGNPWYSCGSADILLISSNAGSSGYSGRAVYFELGEKQFI